MARELISPLHRLGTGFLTMLVADSTGAVIAASRLERDVPQSIDTTSNMADRAYFIEVITSAGADRLAVLFNVRDTAWMRAARASRSVR
jgi:hypothetical protein